MYVKLAIYAKGALRGEPPFCVYRGARRLQGRVRRFKAAQGARSSVANLAWVCARGRECRSSALTICQSEASAPSGFSFPVTAGLECRPF
ncbi:MAG: hypothetical protein AMXMBFR13_02130, partial [Phycisphaerae bacterium]